MVAMATKKQKEAEIRGRVPSLIKHGFDELRDEYDMTADGVMNAVFTWLLEQPQFIQRRVLMGIPEDEILKIADQIRKDRELREAGKTIANDAIDEALRRTKES